MTLRPCLYVALDLETNLIYTNLIPAIFFDCKATYKTNWIVPVIDIHPDVLFVCPRRIKHLKCVSLYKSPAFQSRHRFLRFCLARAMFSITASLNAAMHVVSRSSSLVKINAGIKRNRLPDEKKSLIKQMSLNATYKQGLSFVKIWGFRLPFCYLCELCLWAAMWRLSGKRFINELQLRKLTKGEKGVENAVTRYFGGFILGQLWQGQLKKIFCTSKQLELLSEAPWVIK